MVAAVLSGNRNFEGRINPLTLANYLASPPLVVAYALAGTVDIDLEREPLGTGTDGRPVYLRDIWPTPEEVAGGGARDGDARAVPRPVRQRLRAATSAGASCRRRRASCTPGTPPRPTSRSRRSSRP